MLETRGKAKARLRRHAARKTPLHLSNDLLQLVRPEHNDPPPRLHLDALSAQGRVVLLIGVDLVVDAQLRLRHDQLLLRVSKNHSLLGLSVWCLSLRFVQLTDHDVVTKFKGKVAISSLPHLCHKGLPKGHSDLRRNVDEPLVDEEAHIPVQELRHILENLPVAPLCSLLQQEFPDSSHRLFLLLSQTDHCRDGINLIGIVEVILVVILHLAYRLLDHRTKILLTEDGLCDLADVDHSVLHEELLEQPSDPLIVLFLRSARLKLDLDLIARLLLLIPAAVAALLAARVVRGVDGNHPSNLCLSRTHLLRSVIKLCSLVV